MNEYEGLEDNDEFGGRLDNLCRAIDSTSDFTCEVSETDPELLLVNGEFTGLPEGHYLSINIWGDNTLEFFAEKLSEETGDEVLRQIFGNAPIDGPISLGTVDMQDSEGVRNLLGSLGIVLPANWHDN